MLRLDNMNADAIYVRGLCLYNEDNVDKAFTHFQQVLRLAPDHVKAKEIYKVLSHSSIIDFSNLRFKSFYDILILKSFVIAESKTIETEERRG